MDATVPYENGIAEGMCRDCLRVFPNRRDVNVPNRARLALEKWTAQMFLYVPCS